MQIDNLISPLEERALLPFPASASVLVIAMSGCNVAASV
jgi:hypothetical protein